MPLLRRFFNQERCAGGQAARPGLRSRKARRHRGAWRAARFEPLEGRWLLSAGPLEGRPYIDLGPSDNVAWDQPRVAVELLTDAAGTGSVGPTLFNTFLLDTGANSILAFATAVDDMDDPPHVYATEGRFEEIGVAGTHYFDISLPYRFDFAGTSGVRNTLLDTRILSDANNDISMFGPWGIVGMPAMADRVTTFDYTVWTVVEDLDIYMRVDFGDALPPDTEYRYSVSVDTRMRWTPDEHVIEGDHPPVWADIPLLTAVPVHNGVPAPGTFLFDTGGQLSVLSTALAQALGLDSNRDGVLDERDANFARRETVGGVGGTITAPVFLFDEVHVPTRQGVDLVWTDLQWMVLDIIEGLDGVFGMDLLTSGWIEAFAEDGKSGYVMQNQLDFRDWSNTGAGTVWFDLNPEVHQVIDPNGPGAIVTESGGVTSVSESGVEDTYQVVLSQPPAADVTIRLTNRDGELRAVDAANPGRDYLVFTPANWNVPQTVRVAAVDDGDVEGFHRSSIVHVSSSSDPAYDGVGMPRVITNIVDNDAPGIMIIPTEGSTDVAEGGREDTYQLVLMQAPTRDVTVRLENASGQVTAVDAANPGNAFLVFTPQNWNTPQTVRVSAVDDQLIEGPHKAYITHSISSADPKYGEVFALQETVFIEDNDGTGVAIQQTEGGTEVVEGGATDSYSVVLTSQPAAPVTITVDPGDQLRVDVTTLTFTPINWNQPQLVTVSAVDDLVVEGDHQGKVRHRAASDDPLYHGVSIPDVTVVIRDNDRDLGRVAFAVLDRLEPAGGQLWYRFQTVNPGLLTIEATPDPDADVILTLYDGAGNRLGSELPGAAARTKRIDHPVAAEESYYVSVASDGKVDLRLANLVQVAPDGSVVTVRGTDAEDHFEYRSGSFRTVAINGVEYRFDDTVSRIEFRGTGNDSAVLYGSASGEIVSLFPDSGVLNGPGVEVRVVGTSRVAAVGGGGGDEAHLTGTRGPDVYTGTSRYGRLVSRGGDNPVEFFQRAVGFPVVYVRSEGGGDTARLYGSAGDDQAVADPSSASLTGPGFSHRLDGFREVNLFADEIGSSGNRGYDIARLRDDPASSLPTTFHTTAGTDAKLYDGDPFSGASQVAQQFLIRTSGFDSVTATAGPGDYALLYGTGGDDLYQASGGQGTLSTPADAEFTAVGFEQIHSVGRAGRDRAELVGSPEADGFRATEIYGRLASTGWMHRVVRYEEVRVDAGDGEDVARLVDTAFDDLFVATPGGRPEVSYRAGRFQYFLDGFNVTRLTGREGDSSADHAHLYPRPEDEVIERTGSWVLRGSDYVTIVDKLFGEVAWNPPASGDNAGSLGPAALAAPASAVGDQDPAMLASQWSVQQRTDPVGQPKAERAGDESDGDGLLPALWWAYWG